MRHFAVTLCLLSFLSAPIVAGHRQPRHVGCRIAHPVHYYQSLGRRHHGRFATTHFRRYHYRPIPRIRYAPRGRYSHRYYPRHYDRGYGVSFRYYKPPRYTPHRHHTRPRFSIHIDF